MNQIKFNQLISELSWRGILDNCTNHEKLELAISNNRKAYIGFDPSGPSLHLGNYLQLVMLKRLMNLGIDCVALIGGATGSIGDPSGKSSERNLLSNDIVLKNSECISSQISEVIPKIKIVNNLDYYKSLSIIDFLRNFGKLFNVNYMLEKDSIKNRIETGISYTEFSYLLLQSYDFMTLYKNERVSIQIGGSDQWGNITSGIEAIRKVYSDDNDAVGLTVKLLIDANGKKFGKSENGAIFIDKKLTPTFKMYQFLYSQPDGEVIKLLKHLTFLTEEEINNIEREHNLDKSLKHAQIQLAKNLIVDIHGQKDYERAFSINEALYKSKIDTLNEEEMNELFDAIDSVKIHGLDYDNELSSIISRSQLGISKTEYKRLVEQKGVKVNSLAIDNVNLKISQIEAFHGKFIFVKIGKQKNLLLKKV
jgi:tyrosyl-tRNA synthetase